MGKENWSHRVYTSQAALDNIEFYGSLLTERLEFNSVQDHLEALANRLFKGWLKKDPRTIWEVSNYHPGYISCSLDDLFQSDFTRTDAQQTIAREYGYGEWKKLINHGNIQYESIFEEAVDLLLHGHLSELSELIDEEPDLVAQCSNYGHQAGLIHYCASNGVELWRQQVPLNLAEIIRYLLNRGASKNMKMKVYGGHFNIIDLLKSSAHPFDAGVAKEAIALLEES